MGNRGLWNLRVHGKWYRCCRRPYRVSYPDDNITLERVKDLQQSRTPLQKDGWVDVLFPTPIHPSFSYVYTLDLDEGHLVVTQMNYDSNGVRAPIHSIIHLDEIHTTSDLSDEAILQNSSDPFQQLCHNGGMASSEGLNLPYSNLSISAQRAAIQDVYGLHISVAILHRRPVDMGLSFTFVLHICHGTASSYCVGFRGDFGYSGRVTRICGVNASLEGS